jgi:hypothetical protein
MIVSRPNYPPLEPLPVGLESAVLVAHFDLGIHADYAGERPKRKVAFLWELAACRSDGSHHLIAKEYNATLADSANLRAMLESWRGEPLAEAELERFELGILHGKFCTLDLVRKPKRYGPGTYVDVAAVYRPRKKDPPWIMATSSDYMPEWIAQRIAEALPETAFDDAAADEYVEMRQF